MSAIKTLIIFIILTDICFADLDPKQEKIVRLKTDVDIMLAQYHHDNSSLISDKRIINALGKELRALGVNWTLDWTKTVPTAVNWSK